MGFEGVCVFAKTLVPIVGFQLAGIVFKNGHLKIWALRFLDRYL